MEGYKLLIISKDNTLGYHPLIDRLGDKIKNTVIAKFWDLGSNLG